MFIAYPGDIVSLRAGGGGGVGDPQKRRREDIELNIQSGKVSAEAARSQYSRERAVVSAQGDQTMVCDRRAVELLQPI